MTVSADFASVADQFRGELLAHCYRMLGSADEAEDLVQDTYLRAWRAYGTVQGPAPPRTRLYPIATHARPTPPGPPRPPAPAPRLRPPPAAPDAPPRPAQPPP